MYFLLEPTQGIQFYQHLEISSMEYISDLRCPELQDNIFVFFKPLHGLPQQLSWLRIGLQCRRPQLNSWVRKFPWRRDRLPTPLFLGFPAGSDGRESVSNVRDLGLIPALGRSPGRGHGNPLQCSCLENPLDRGAWWATVHGVSKIQTQTGVRHD